MKYTNLTIHSDGGARGNPGPAAYGFVVTSEDNEVIYERGEYIGETTNNVAEYTGVLKSLEWIDQNIPEKPERISVVLDSELVARQLSGVYKVKNENLRGYYHTIKKLEESVGVPIRYTSVPRIQNKKADALVNSALDTHLLD